jgi:hypothetical protein
MPAFRHRKMPLTNQLPGQKNNAFKNTAGISEENRCLGFRPAFYDVQPHRAELVRFSNGAPAPFIC